MKLGAAAHIFWDLEKEELDLEDAIHEIGEIGYDSVEILCDTHFFPHWETDKLGEGVEEVKDYLSTFEVEATLHAPHYDVNLAAWNRGFRREFQRQVGECIEVAPQLDADIVVVHPGEVASKKLSRRKTIQNMVQSLEYLAGAAREHGVTLCLENNAQNPSSLCVSSKEVVDVVDAVESSHVQVCCDISHIRTTREEPVKYIENLGDRISHVHVSDALGATHHLPIDLGVIEFDEVFKILDGFDGVVNVEGWAPNSTEKFLSHSRDRLLEYINN